MITYGMSARSLAERMGLSERESEQIIEDFYKGFEGVKKLTDDSQQMLKEKGYVTDMWGRRRHLPDAQLPDFTIRPSDEYMKKFGFNPLLGTSEHSDQQMEMKIEGYRQRLSKLQWKKDIDKVINEAKKDDLKVINNKGFKSRALRQCLNARIQGTAASMTKKAMIMIHNDEELNRLGARLLVTVHDEVFMEAPTENSEQVAKRLSEVMVAAAKTKCVCKFKCDPYIVKRWYADEFSGEVHNDYVKMIKKMSEQEAFDKIKTKYSAVQEKYLRMMCDDNYDPNIYEDI